MIHDVGITIINHDDRLVYALFICLVLRASRNLLHYDRDQLHRI